MGMTVASALQLHAQNATRPLGERLSSQTMCVRHRANVPSLTLFWQFAGNRLVSRHCPQSLVRGHEFGFQLPGHGRQPPRGASPSRRHAGSAAR